MWSILQAWFVVCDHVSWVSWLIELIGRLTSAHSGRTIFLVGVIGASRREIDIIVLVCPAVLDVLLFRTGDVLVVRMRARWRARRPSLNPRRGFRRVGLEGTASLGCLSYRGYAVPVGGSRWAVLWWLWFYNHVVWFLDDLVAGWGLGRSAPREHFRSTGTGVARVVAIAHPGSSRW